MGGFFNSLLELSAKENPAQFVKLDELDEFDFNLLSPDGNLTGQYPIGVGAWKFLLSLRLLALMQEDHDLLKANRALIVLKEDLEQIGLLPSPNVASLAREAFQDKATGRFKFLLELSSESDSTQDWVSKKPSQLGDVLSGYLSIIKSPKHKYILVLDGIDQIFRIGVDHASTVSDLIRATRVINENLFRTRIDAKIVLLLRDDVMRLIPDPDLGGKRLTDNGIYLGWYERADNPFKTQLFAVLKRRAELAGFEGDIRSLWPQWFPRVVYQRRSEQYFIERTRYLPRDLIAFLTGC